MDQRFLVNFESKGSEQLRLLRHFFARKAVNLRREYSINQIEYCRNFIFKRHFPIHKIFEHSCEMGLFRLAADKVAYIFGVRVSKRLRSDRKVGNRTNLGLR